MVLVAHSNVLTMLVVKVLVVHVSGLVGAGTTSHRRGVLDAIRLGDSFEEASFQLTEFGTRLLDLFWCQPIEVGSPTPKDLFPDAVRSHKLLRYPHRIAIQKLAEKGSERGSVREGKQTRLEFLDEAVGVGFFFRRPLSSPELLALLFRTSTGARLPLLLLLLLSLLGNQLGLGRRHGQGILIRPIAVTIALMLSFRIILLLYGPQPIGLGCGISRLHKNGRQPIAASFYI
jgi:hypothetical protein